MAHRFWRQRRRLVLGTGLATAAGAMFGPVMAGVAALAGLLFLMTVVALWPEWRIFALKLCALGVPVAYAATQTHVPIPSGALIAGGALLVAVFPSNLWWLDKLRLPYITRACAVRTMNCDRAALWAKLIPHETNEHWDPMVRGVRPGRLSETFFYVYDPVDAGGELQIPMRLFDVEPKVHFKTRDLSQPSAQAGGPVTVTSHVFEDDGPRCRLTLIEATWRQGMWSAFNMWLDDFIADHLDRMAALIEQRPDPSIKGALLRATQGD